MQHEKKIFSRKLVALLPCFLWILQLAAQPIAEADVSGVCSSDTLFINVLANDLGDGLELDEIIIEPEYGNANEVGDSIIRYRPDEDFIGTDVLIYQIVDADENFDISTLTIYVQDSMFCVWPGDANNDGIANNKDILNIGLYYGNEGPARYNTDGDWNEEYCDEWNDDIILSGLADPKLSDCNGDGVIDANDTLQILSNYGQLHALKTTELSGGSDLPPLYVDFFTDTIQAGTTVLLPLKLGTIDIPATNIYGLSFSISGGDGIIVPGSLRVTFNSGWLGVPGTDLIAINYYDSTTANYDVGVTRINHTAISGYGNIGTVSFVMEDDLAGKVNGLAVQLVLCPTLTLALNDFGQALDIYSKCDTVIAYQGNTGISSQYENALKIFPNPALYNTTIYFTENMNGTIRIQNISGMETENFEFKNRNQFTINTSRYPSGTYIMEIQNGTMVQYQKLIVQH